MSEVFLEDLKPGQIFTSGTLRVETDEIIGFAAQYDPQPFHLSEATAKNTFFRGLQPVVGILPDNEALGRK